MTSTRVYSQMLKQIELVQKWQIFGEFNIRILKAEMNAQLHWMLHSELQPQQWNNVR